MDIAKITNDDEFIKVISAYKSMIGDPQAIVSTKKELKLKVENYIRKQIMSLNKKAQKEKEEGG